MNIKELGLLESKNNIDYTQVETFDKFPQKYMNEPKEDLNETEEENQNKWLKNENQKIMN